ncbi:MAG: RHS repeat domain-containing protein [Terriglobia bacterium]
MSSLRQPVCNNSRDLTQGDAGHTYQWDAEGRLTSVDSGSSATYTYNALGLRVEDVIPGFRIEYLYDAFGREMGSYDANGAAWWNRYIPLGGQSLGKYLGTSTYFFHVNHLGSSTMVSDHTGTVTQKALFYPFGQLWVSGGSGVTRRFASLQEPLPNAGPEVYAAPFRDYQSRLYRWLSPDPLAGDILNPQSLNRYAYALNNPTNLIDPLGLFCKKGEECPTGDDANTIDTDDLPGPGPSPSRSRPGGGRGGAGGGGRGGSRGNPIKPFPISDFKSNFYQDYGEHLNDCILKVFCEDAASVPIQMVSNAPAVITSRTQAQLGAMSNMSGASTNLASGSNAAFSGRYGTIFISAEDWAASSLSYLQRTYAHELGNILDARLNYRPGHPENYEMTYGNPEVTPRGEPADTGAALEDCIFSSDR